MNTELEALVSSWLAYLEAVRDGGELDDDDVWERFEELVTRQPKAALDVALEVVARAGEEDLSLIGTGVLQSLLVQHPQMAAKEFEAQLRASGRFLKAFQYTAMTGVPLEVQRRLNAALLERGVDPKFVVEYDESEDDGQ